eukprot:6154405-Prymnesium_polylepis.2
MSYRKYHLPGRPQRAGCWWVRSQFDGLASAASMEGVRGGGTGRRLPSQGRRLRGKPLYWFTLLVGALIGGGRPGRWAPTSLHTHSATTISIN